MSSRLTQVFLGLSLLLNCFVLAGFVYRSWISPPHWQHHAGPPPPPRGGPIESLVQELNLNDAQRAALRGALDKNDEHRRERFRDMQKIHGSMAEELQKPQLDLAKVDALVDEMSKLRNELFKENMAVIAELAPQLNEEQREHLHKILAERFGGQARGRSPGEPRPGQGPGR